ncbi:MAG: class I SAM-dependent methyltransferase [Saprospiraceae bacterium]
MPSNQDHWDHVYATKRLEDVSWYQPIPRQSLEYIDACGLDRHATIIDIGGGDSFLVDHLLIKSYDNITVLDISENAIQRAKDRLAEKQDKVQWLITNILDFTSPTKYQIWHDRAAFHFLTDEDDISAYVDIATKAIVPNGYLIIATFSTNGPKKCSGLDICQYDSAKMKTLWAKDFLFEGCSESEHPTPSGGLQNFIFCKFRKKS